MMRYNLTAIAAALLLTGLSYGQTDSTEAEGPWKRGAVMGLNFSQTYLSNWQGGGQSAINGTVLFNYFANYAKNKWTWENSVDAAYGLTRIGDKGVFQKTDDRIEINTKVGLETPFDKHTYWAGFGTFRTQWDAGYDFSSTGSPLISDPFAPAYVIAGLGIDYKPSEAFSALLSPATAKITIVDNQRLANAGAFGVEAATYDAAGMLLTEGETMRYEIGGYFKMAYTRDVFTNVKFSTKIELFSNYLNNPQNIDVNWENLVAMKINDFLSASITTNLIYDHDIKLDTDNDGVPNGPRTQFKEVFALGIQYQF